MNNIERRVTAHPFTKSLSDKALNVLIGGAREQVFEAGQIILRAREPANSIYLIEEGKVAIEAHDAHGADRPLQTIGPGSALGWSWLYAPFTWRLQARAVERTRMLRLDGGHVLAHCEADHSVGYEIMKRVSQVLIERLHAATNPPRP